MPSSHQPEDVVRELVKSLQAAREAAGMSKYRLAKDSGVTLQAVITIERGQCNPTLYILLKLAAALNFPLGKRLAELENGRE